MPILLEVVGVRTDDSSGANWNRPDELKILVACRGWSRGHVNTRSKKVTAENTLALAA